MILYLDASALVKLFVDKSGSDEVLSWAAAATAVACSHLGYSEAVSAFSRRLRAGSLARATYDRVLDELERRWVDVVTVTFDRRLNEAAAAEGLRVLGT